jgi:signal transduction histidine kinase
LLLSELCLKASVQNAEQALAYGQQGLVLAQRLHYAYGKINCLNALAQAESMRQNYVATTHYYQQTVREAEPVPQAARQLTFALIGLGQLAAQQEEFIDADGYFRLAIKRMRQHLHPASALDFTLVQSHLATLYLGWLQSGRPAPDSLPRLHEHYARLALAAFQRLSAGQPALHSKLGFAFDNLAMVHMRAQRYDSATYCETKAIQLFRQAANNYGLIHAQQTLAEVRLAQHRWAEAARLARPTIAWARQLASKGMEANGQQLLATALDHTGRSHEAYQLAMAGQAIFDSLNSAARLTALSRLRVQFETERQREQVRTLTQRNRLQQAAARRQRQLLLGLAGLLLAVVAGLAASGTLAWRLRRSRALLARQNAELTATRAEQDRLYALVAHDLRNPVEAFTGLADLLTHYVARQDTARLAGLGGRVRQAAQGLRGLLDNLLSWALTQRGELVPKLEKLAVGPLLAEAAELYQPSAEAAGLTLAVEPGACGAGLVVADLNMTRTILRNFISNALRATPAGGAIWLSAEAAAGTITIRVRDTGEGMSAEQVQLLLGASTAPPPATGRPAGLGLRLIQTFALAQHGHLALASQPGQGTTATLMLPSATPAVAVPGGLVSLA